MTAPSIKSYQTRVAAGLVGGNGRMTVDGLVPSDDMPLVTIVTVVFNNRTNLRRAIKSVLGQTYRNIEYIIIDGGSTDGTQEIIHAYEPHIAYWHSAPDGGISDAFNWGVSLARGAVIGLVNSDDWMAPDQVAIGVSALASGAPFVFGDLVYHNMNGSDAYTIKGDAEYWHALWHRMPQVTHPTALVRRDVYKRHGLFDLSLKIGMDYDWLYRLHLRDLHGRYSDEIKGHMSLGGISDVAWRRCMDEHLSVALRHGGNRPLLTILFFLRKMKIRIRLMVERCLPRRAAVMIRRLLNPSMRLR